MWEKVRENPPERGKRVLFRDESDHEDVFIGILDRSVDDPGPELVILDGDHEWMDLDSYEWHPLP